MAFFQKNPFIAPDIKDILAEKRSAVRTLMMVFGAGIVLVSVLLGGYRIGQWILWNTAPHVVSPNLPQETRPLITIESRLKELGTTSTTSTTTLAYASSTADRVKELESGMSKTGKAQLSAAALLQAPHNAADMTSHASTGTMPSISAPKNTTRTGSTTVSIDERLQQLGN